MTFRFYIALALVVFFVTTAVFAETPADFLRFLAVSVTLVLYVQIVAIAFAHYASPTKRFPNWVIWAMGYAYILVTIEDVGTAVGNMGEESLYNSTPLLVASAGLAELFMYRLAKEFGRV